MIGKIAWSMLLILAACSAEGAGEEQPAELERALEPQKKGGGSGSYSCTVEQCNGNLNPFGTCTHSVNGVCVECTAGSHVGSCSGAGACPETNCPPVLAPP